MNKYIYLIGLLLVALSSCGRYEKILKSTDYKLKYAKAFEYYKLGEFTKSATIFDQIVSVYKGTDKSDSVSYYQALSYYGQKDYYLAGPYLKSFFENYPYSPFAEEAEYLSAFCFYKTSPRPSLDQENTFAALDAFQLFITKHPASHHVADCKALIAELQDKLVEKSFKNAKLYFDLGNYKSSIVAIKNSLNEYPNTKYREDLQYLSLESNYLLAKNSIPQKQKERYQATVDEYYSFIAEFPNSKFSKEAKRIYEESDKASK